MVGAAIGSAAQVFAQVLVVGLHEFVAAFSSSARAVTGQSRGLWVSILPGGVVLAVLVGVGFIAGVLWASRVGQGDERLGIGWSLCTVLLLSPLVWWFYLSWLLPAITACLAVALAPEQRPVSWRHSWRRWGALALLGLVYALICAHLHALAYADAGSALAALILWGLCGAYYLRRAGVITTGISSSVGANQIFAHT